MTMKEIIRTYIAENLGIDDDETFEMLYENYTDTVKTSIGNIEKALLAQTPEDLRAAAHALKGCSANIGAESIRSASSEIEIAAKASDFNTAKTYFDTVKNLFQTL